MLGEKGDHAVVDPAAVAELHGHAHIAREHRQETGERRQLVRGELGPELHQHRSEFGSELPRAREEQVERRRYVAQPVLVCDLLRHLERELEVVRHALGPVAQRARRRDGVEGRVDFDSVERPRVDAKEVEPVASLLDKRARPRRRSSTLGAESHRFFMLGACGFTHHGRTVR